MKKTIIILSGAAILAVLICVSLRSHNQEEAVPIAVADAVDPNSVSVNPAEDNWLKNRLKDTMPVVTNLQYTAANANADSTNEIRISATLPKY